jgi:uncharacterized delta-60 repeat protein
MRSIGVGALALAALAAGGHGRLDPSFGWGGDVLTPIRDGSGARAIALQPDGRLVVAGWATTGSNADFEVVRYTARGGPDRRFGQDGKVTTDFGTDNDHATSVKVQRDGKIVVAGYAGTDSPRLAVARYRSNGSLDPSFGTNGEVLEPGLGFALALQRDGKLVVGGAYGPDFALYRLKPDGSLDTGFGTSGEVTTSFGASPGAEVHGLAIQSDGKIVAVGQAFTPGFGIEWAMARYNPDGSLDSTFGTGGKVMRRRDGGLGAVVLQGSRRILATGGNALVGLRRNGNLDPSFGRGGVTPTPVGGLALALQRDGKIAVAGSRPGEDDNDFALARFSRDGKPDPSFQVRTNMSDGLDLAYGLVIQRDGKPVVAGEADEVGLSGGMIALARYLAPYRCTVPNVKRLPISAAKRSLREAHCSLGRVIYAFSNTVGNGRVISQLPAPGSSRPEHSRVQLVVSSGRR